MNLLPIIALIIVMAFAAWMMYLGMVKPDFLTQNPAFQRMSKKLGPVISARIYLYSGVLLLILCIFLLLTKLL